jgi:hypothetical protein
MRLEVCRSDSVKYIWEIPVIVRQVGWGGIATEMEESLLN